MNQVIVHKIAHVARNVEAAQAQVEALASAPASDELRKRWKMLAILATNLLVVSYAGIDLCK